MIVSEFVVEIRFMSQSLKSYSDVFGNFIVKFQPNHTFLAKLHSIKVWFRVSILVQHLGHNMSARIPLVLRALLIGTESFRILHKKSLCLGIMFNFQSFFHIHCSASLLDDPCSLWKFHSLIALYPDFTVYIPSLVNIHI